MAFTHDFVVGSPLLNHDVEMLSTADWEPKIVLGNLWPSLPVMPILPLSNTLMFALFDASHAFILRTQCLAVAY